MVSRALALLAIILLAAPASAQQIPFREDSGLTKAEAQLTDGHFAAAIDTASGVLMRHPANADAYTYRGYAMMRLGDDKAAARDLQMALKINPAHLGANKYLADLYLAKGQTARALEQLQVIRMTCGQGDCAELRALEAAIDQARANGAPAE